MKKILITGANSYIGTSFERYINENYPNEYVVDTVDMIDGAWREKDFSEYDSVFHVAGIAHQKETEKNARLYYQVNEELAVETAKKARAEGVKQFVFMSSMSVYGMDTGVITRETVPAPRSHYGRSKWQAEQRISPMACDEFKVCIIRPPMVYGKGCKGNFQTVLKIVKKSPIFPYVKNQRSMIYIDNLCSFVRMAFDGNLDGVFFPQNREYVATVDMAREMANAIGKRIYFEYLTGFIVRILRLFLPLAKKAFGNLIYRIDEPFEYCTVENIESVKRSVAL